MTRHPAARRGATLVESAFVLSVLFFLLLSVVIGGHGVLRYQQLAMLAREGARYASVHGGQYAQENNTTVPTQDQIFTNVIAPMAVGFDTTQMGYSITYNTTSWPYHTTLDSNNNVVPIQNTVTVKLTYTWVPEAFLGGVTLSATSVMPMSY
jgi:Flp pilus assembly protein TadG